MHRSAAVALLLAAALVGLARADYDNSVWDKRERPFIIGHRGCVMTC